MTNNKKEDLKASTDIEEAIKDNKDLIDLVELSDDEELSTLEEVDSNLKKIKKDKESIINKLSQLSPQEMEKEFARLV